MSRIDDKRPLPPHVLLDGRESPPAPGKLIKATPIQPAPASAADRAEENERFAAVVRDGHWDEVIAERDALRAALEAIAYAGPAFPHRDIARRALGIVDDPGPRSTEELRALAGRAGK